MGVRFLPLAKKELLGAALALLPGIGLVECSLLAQPPAAASRTQVSTPNDAKVRIKGRVFHFPIRIDKASQARIHEVHLYMRDGANGDWVRLDSVPPTAEKIRCQVPHDGEFSFILQSIDNFGNAYPPNLNQQPSMTVVVESEPTMPVTTLQTQPPAANPVAVQYTLPTEAPSLPPPPTAEGTPVPLATPSNPAQTPSVMPTVTSTVPANTPVRIVNQQPGGNQIIQPSATTAQTNSSPVPTTPLPPVVPSVTAAPKTVPANHSAPPSTARQYFNSTRIGIDYNVSRVGPSGLGKVEVWATQDQGQTWRRAGDKTSQRSPAEADLPGEGIYGIRLVATNGNGLGGRVPQAGDPATITVEIDTTSPAIHSLDVEPIAKNGVLDIRWRVTDKNLDTVNLFYAGQRSGPWTPLAFKVKADDVHHWTLPKDVPTQLYFRVEATDLAGNVSRSDSQMPIMLDMTEPDLNVTGISIMPQRSPTTPGGN